MLNRCPDCGKNHDGKTKICACGGILVNETLTNDDKCHHWEFGKRCDLKGSMSKSTKGRTNKWYCWKHWYSN
ncbi:MAG: hypothetical protein ACYCQI_11650 [Gammaproteobacteria bacterium]